MFKLISSFQSFFIANQSQATASPSFTRSNIQSEESGRVKSQKLKQNKKTNHKVKIINKEL
jgi:hypothetical protein